MHVRYTFGLLIVVLLGGTAAQAQDVRYFEPPAYSIELSGYEPLPPGVGSELRYGEYGAGPGDVEQPEGLHWAALPEKRLYPAPSMGAAVACGYPAGEAPYATLTYPDGLTYEVTDSDGFLDDDCWSYSLYGVYGMQLGEYMLVLDHALGVLSALWNVDYPDFLTEIEFTDTLGGSDVRQIALMGFAPYETVLVHFYAAQELYGASYYAASRTVEADAYGALWIELETTRSAPFGLWDVILTLDAYNKYRDPDTSTIYFAERQVCPNSLISRLAVGGSGYVTPGNSNRVRDVPEGTVTGSLPAESIFYVIDGPLCGGQNGLMWWHVRNSDGIDGWTVESDDSDYWLAPLF